MKKYLVIGFILLSGCAWQSPLVTELVGKDQDYVIKKQGQPIVIRSEEPNQVWVYRYQDCSQLIFFDQAKIVRWVDLSGQCQDIPDDRAH